MSDQEPGPTSFLLAELAHFGESLWRNEEIGEKRVEFFLSIATAIVAGLVALYTKEKGPPEKFDSILNGALIGLLALGVLTYLRLLHRNRVTDQYQRTLRYLRRKLLAQGSVQEGYDVPVAMGAGRWRWFRGGLAETVGTCNAVITGALVTVNGDGLWWGGLAGTSVLVGSWVLAAPRHGGGQGPAEYFRAGVGALIINREGMALMLERRDVPGSWQLPQGGLEHGEQPVRAVFREVREETGIKKSMLVLRAQYPVPLLYELPAEYRRVKTGRGQVQYWFLLGFSGKDDDVDVARGEEFRTAKWVRLPEVVALAPEFRQAIYRTITRWSHDNPK